MDCEVGVTDSIGKSKSADNNTLKRILMPSLPLVNLIGKSAECKFAKVFTNSIIWGVGEPLG